MALAGQFLALFVVRSAVAGIRARSAKKHLFAGTRFTRVFLTLALTAIKGRENSRLDHSRLVSSKGKEKSTRKLQRAGMVSATPHRRRMSFVVAQRVECVPGCCGSSRSARGPCARFVRKLRLAEELATSVHHSPQGSLSSATNMKRAAWHVNATDSTWRASLRRQLQGACSRT